MSKHLTIPSDIEVEFGVDLFSMEDPDARQFSGEQKLLVGVLKMAIFDLLNPVRLKKPYVAVSKRSRKRGRLGGHRKRKQLSMTEAMALPIFSETLDWVEEDLPDEPMSFVYCCEGVGIEPSGLRKRLLAELKKRYH